MSPLVSTENSLLSACICRVGLGRLVVWDTVNASGGMPLKTEALDGGAGLMIACRVSRIATFRATVPKDDKAVKFTTLGARH